MNIFKEFRKQLNVTENVSQEDFKNIIKSK